MAKLNRLEFMDLKSRYLSKLSDNNIPMDQVKHYISKDITDSKQAEKMIKELDKKFTEIREDELDLLLFDVLEILQETPTKWTVDKDNNLYVVYPHPVISNDRITGVEYKPHKNYYFEDAELFDRYIALQNAIVKKSKKKKVSGGRGRPSKFSTEQIAEWAKLKDQGYRYKDIAEITDVHATTIGSYVRKYKKEQKAG
ncbi:transposase [Halobacillus sp. B29]|uniref:transposase n=1 Tax=Halobacillus sp. B29 TaxID=3457432 RepID=UPI003FCEB90B